MLLKEVFNKGPRLLPDKLAMIENSRRLTYREAGERWNRLANALIDLGIKKGDVLCVLLKNCIEVIDAHGAAAKTGTVCACINFRLNADAIKAVLEDARCPVLILGDEFVEMIRSIRPQLPLLRACISVGCQAEGMIEFDTLIGKYPSSEPEISVSDADPAVINYTSGTTGAPKGAVADRQSVVYRLCNGSLELALEPSDSYFVALPLFHVGANMPVMASIFRGATVVIQKEWDPEAFCRIVQEEKVTKAILTPGLLNFVLNFPDVAKYDLSSFQRIQYGGSPMAVEVLQRIMKLMPKCRFQQGYGTSETFTQTILGPEVHEAAVSGSQKAMQTLKSIGREAVLCRVRVVNADGMDVKPGEIGEIVLGGPMIMSRYLNKPKETADKLIDGWFYSGDLATVDEENHVILVDRKNNMIITGGENVYPSQVENVLYGHPGIAEVAVLGVPDPKWGEAVKAVVVVRAGETVTPEEVIDFCRDKMANYAKPKSVDFVDELPHLATGKIDKLALRNRYWQE